MMQRVQHDLRFALRQLLKNPGFTAIVVLTLAIGIGTNTAIFSVLNVLFLHPPGIPHPERVVVLRVRYGKLGLKNIVASAADFAQIRDSPQIFAAAALETTSDFNYRAGEWPEMLQGAQVSWQWFDVFGARPLLGRVFTPEEDQPNTNHEVVLSYGAWQHRFGSDRNVIGRSILLNALPYRVIGVMGPEFHPPNLLMDIWTPLGLPHSDFSIENTFNESYLAVARLQPNTTFSQASAYVDVLSKRLIDNPVSTYAKDTEWGMFLMPLTDFVFGDLRAPVLILAGAVGFVLMIACANIAGLLLAKAAGRSKELAVRSALGASRGRIIIQTLRENAVLGLLGVLAGLLVAQIVTRALLFVAPPDLATGINFPVDRYVLFFTAVIGILAVLTFGSAPAWYMSRVDPYNALRESGRSATASRGKQRFRSVLVVAELALGLVLLAGTGLLLTSLARISKINPGFQPRGAMTASLSLPGTQYDTPEKQIAFFRRVLDSLSHAPGVTSAGAGFPLPFTGANNSASFDIEGRPTSPADPGPHGDVRYTTAGYFTALGIPLFKGRLFTDDDRLGSQPVVLIDENLAREYWPNDDPIGKRIRQGSRDHWSTIVGVVGHIRFNQLAGEESSSQGVQISSKGAYYFPLYQTAAPFGFLIAKFSRDPNALASVIRQAVRDADSNLPVSDMKSMDARITESFAPQRFAGVLLGVFAVLATVLAAVGLYGLVSYSVAERTNELGIRIALGADRSDVLLHVLGLGSKLALAGTVAGVLIGILLMHTMQSEFYAVSVVDTLSFAGSAILLTMVALVASYIPAPSHEYRPNGGFEIRIGGRMNSLWQDLRYAVRMLAKSPGFTAVVVLSLALGIGANTAIFSLIDAVMLRFLPVKNPEELLLLKWNWHGEGSNPPQVHSLAGGKEVFSYPTFKEIQASRKIFSSTLAFSSNNDEVNLAVDGQARLAGSEMVSGSYFETLGVRPIIGRLLMESDDRPESPPVAVISYGYWQRRFGGSPSVVGKPVTLNGIPFTIIGVTPPEFFGLSPGSIPNVWMPLNTQPKVEPLWTEDGKSKFLRRDDWWLSVVGRLQPGVTPQAAVAQLGMIFQRSITYPENSPAELHDTGDRGRTPSALPTLEFIPGGKGIERLRNEFSQSLFILMAVVALVLLIACVNVANLLLARATSRYKEIAVRFAIGAARKRLIRQLLTESMLLAAAGGACGLGLAYSSTRALATLVSRGNELANLGVQPDLRVLAFTAGISLFTGILFGLVPALRATRLDLTSALKEKSASAGAEKPERLGLGSILVVSQVTISLLLVAGAGLFVRTLVNLQNVDSGFDAHNVLLFRIVPTENGYEDVRLAQFYEDLREKLTTIPGVRYASLMGHGLVGGGTSSSSYSIQGYTPSVGESRDGVLGISDDQVGPDYFETMGIPLLLGRTIKVSDTATSPKIAVVNQAFARKYLGKTNPIGRRLGTGTKSSGKFEIVGVVGNTKYRDLRGDYPAMVFLARLQNLDKKDYGGMTFAMRTTADPHTLIPTVGLAIKSLDPNLPISNVRTQMEQVDQTLSQERLFAKLSSLFGLLALILACIGLYGIMSYSVVRRTNEIGIRMALGARQEDILSAVLWQALLLVVIGVAIGIPLALGVLRLISSMLFGLKPSDPETLAASIAFMLIVAAIASYIPARRAAKVDPMVALRYE